MCKQLLIHFLQFTHECFATGLKALVQHLQILLELPQRCTRHVMARLHYGCELLALLRSGAWRGPLPAIPSTQGIATFASPNVRELPP